MNNLNEVYKYIETIRNLEVNDISIEELRKFIKVSPEKLSDKFGLERGPLTKEFDLYKKEIHNKIIIYDKVKLLCKKEILNFNFKYGNNFYKTKICICLEYFTFKFKSLNTKFYPTIKYLYCDDIIENNIIIFSNKNEIHISKNEFEKYFQNYREFTLNILLNDTKNK